MPTTLPHRIDTTNPAQTEDLAQRVAAVLRPGDVIALDGPIGAGKTHFARALIRCAQGALPEDIPSPTFTLVQTYDTELGEIWHADLYRLSDVQEVIELGLDDALGSAICLIEWPDRMGTAMPDSALRIAFAVTRDDARRLTFSGPATWAARLDPVLSPERAGV